MTMSTPTKTAEIIREALEAACKELDCSDWGEVDVNGEGAIKPYSHDIVAMPQGCPACKIRRALSLLADLDGGGEVVKDAMPTYDAGLLSDYGGGNVEWWQDYLRAELNRADDFYQSWWQSTHPSPTAADAPTEADSRKPVDVAEVIKAGEELIRCHRGFHEAIAQHTGKPYPWEPMEAALDHWTSATKPFRP